MKTLPPAPVAKFADFLEFNSLKIIGRNVSIFENRKKNLNYSTLLFRWLVEHAAYLIPWEGKIKSIESQFGSVVSSYFLFLRWVIMVNFIMSSVILLFVMMPEVLSGRRLITAFRTLLSLMIFNGQVFFPGIKSHDVIHMILFCFTNLVECANCI